MVNTRRRILDAQLDAMSDQHLECRLLGHAPDARSQTVTHNGRETTVVRRCACGVKRKVVLVSSRGRVERRSELDYSDAPGYLLEGIGRPDRQDRGHINDVAKERLFG